MPKGGRSCAAAGVSTPAPAQRRSRAQGVICRALLLLPSAAVAADSERPPGNNSLSLAILAEAPWVARVRNILSAKESALVRRLVYDAVVYFNDTSATHEVRQGARALNPGSTLRPRYRMQNERQLSLYFERPPEVMMELYRRVGRVINIDPSNMEAIYHLYAPGALPANVHMDNFNKLLFPHRFASLSVFFEDLEDGGTVFPLYEQRQTAEDEPEALPIAVERQEVARWHGLVNATRMDPYSDGYAYRRVESDESDWFRRRTFEVAGAMCRGGRSKQGLVIPERGTMYIWKNYLANGEDDVRTMHAGCGASKSMKILGTLFMRDWPGPYQEHNSFWDPLIQREDRVEELQRELEGNALQSFRIRNLKELYEQQRKAMAELQGPRAAAWLQNKQRKHLDSLMEEQVDEDSRARIEAMADRYSGAQITWSKVAPAEGLF